MFKWVDKDNLSSSGQFKENIDHLTKFVFLALIWFKKNIIFLSQFIVFLDFFFNIFDRNWLLNLKEMMLFNSYNLQPSKRQHLINKKNFCLCLDFFKLIRISTLFLISRSFLQKLFALHFISPSNIPELNWFKPLRRNQ